jgi:membrane fusion protein (multidrug efflux system)
MLKRATVIPIIVLGVAALLLFLIAGRWTLWQGNRSDQKTDDAYVRADQTPLSTRVSSTVRAVNVGDFQAVQAGQVLVELNDEDYRAVLAQAEAALAASEAQYATSQSAKKVSDAKVLAAQTTVSQAQAALAAAQGGVDSSKADVVRTGLELDRQNALLAEKATTRQRYEAAQADSQRFSGMLVAQRATLDKASAGIESSQAGLVAERSARRSLDVQDNVYRADIEAKKAAVQVAKVNLGYTRITAPVAGIVGERKVLPGQLVTPGMQVLQLVQGDVWLLANFRETQLTNMQPGDRADIRIDAFPGVLLHGKVAEIAPASGSQFALLPPDNATGNFTKVVQRIPVKIVLDPDHPLKDRLRPGFSASVTVNTGTGEARR